MLDFNWIFVLSSVFLYFPFFLYWRNQKKNQREIGIYSLFYVYLILVIKYTQFPILYGNIFVEAYEGLGIINYNLIPLITLKRNAFYESGLNVLLFLPFGFLYFIITKFQVKQTILAGVLTSVGIELLQLMIGMITKVNFRVPDVNDIIFNGLGTIVGIGLSLVWNSMAKKVFSNWKT